MILTNMRNVIVPLVLALAVSIIISGYGESYRQYASAESKPTINPTVNKVISANYQGVSFTFDSLLASGVKAETIPSVLEGKPSDIVPKYPLFTLVGYPRSDDPEIRSPELRVFRVDKFREAVATAGKEANRSVVYPPNPPEWTVYFDKEVQVLKLLLAKKPSQINVGPFLAKARGEKGCGQMPFLPMWEACQAFAARAGYVDFKNGKGVLFLTQWNRETYPITNKGLIYAFQGITDDGKHYVSAEFSVAAPFLPHGSEPEVVEWATKNYLLPHKSKEYQSYLRPILEELEGLPADQFRPNLTLIENLIVSLQIHAKKPRQK
jgi:hypothetical protein